MTRKLTLGDNGARRLLALHHLRIRHLLSAVPRKVRRELETELDEHLFEIYEHTPGQTEIERLQASFRRLGDPRDFLTPLIGAALFNRAAEPRGAWALLGNLAAMAQAGLRNAGLLVLNAVIGLTGAGLVFFALAVFLRPGMAGVFPEGDGVQVRIFGWPTDDVSVLPIWGAVLIGLAGAGLLYLAQKWVWHSATGLIGRAFPTLSGIEFDRDRED